MTETCEAARDERLSRRRRQAIGLIRNLLTWFATAKDGEYVLTQSAELIALATGNKRRERTHNPRVPVALQEACFSYWSHGRNNPTVRQNAPHKVCYEHVFDYYRRELSSLGITSAALFKRALRARSDRISRS